MNELRTLNVDGYNPMQTKSLMRIREELDFSFSRVFSDEDWNKFVESVKAMLKEYDNGKRI